jgi:hypothetical protein
MTTGVIDNLASLRLDRGKPHQFLHRLQGCATLRKTGSEVLPRSQMRKSAILARLRAISNGLRDVPEVPGLAGPLISEHPRGIVRNIGRQLRKG